MLKLNKWHFMEALMGQIARVDFYTDICFIVLLTECMVLEMMIPSIISISLMLTYPIYKIFRLLKLEDNLLHTLPKIERNCKLSFIRENMMLAVVLDSFCITNYEYVCKKNVFFPRVMGATTLFLQDIPQLFLHAIFLWVIHTEVPHSDLTVTLSLITSVFAIMVSLFNVIVSHPNHFDPWLLKYELDKRKSKNYRERSKSKRERWEERGRQLGNDSNSVPLEIEDSKDDHGSKHTKTDVTSAMTAKRRYTLRRKPSLDDHPFNKHESSDSVLPPFDDRKPGQFQTEVKKSVPPSKPEEVYIDDTPDSYMNGSNISY